MTLLRFFSSARLIAFATTLIFASSSVAQSEQVIRYNGGNDDFANAITGDLSGAIYVAGGVRDISQPIQFAVVKHNAQGSVQWLARYLGLPGEIDGRAGSVVTDAAGNVYAGGHVARKIGFAYHIDWLVVSFTPSGTQRWAHVLNTPGEGFEQAARLAADPSGAIYATGISGLGNNFDWLTIKYSSTGTILWQRTKGGVSNADDRPVAAKLDSAGNLIVLGYTSNIGLGLAKDLSIVKYDPQGSVLWSRDFSDTPASDEFPGGLTLDSFGNIYVTGITVASSSPELPNVPFTLKYDANGNPLFLIKGETAGGTSVATSPDGNVVVTGTAIGEAGSFIRSAVTKITPVGAQLWTTPMATDGEIAVGADGSVYLGGTKFSSGFDYFAAKLTTAGQILWQRTTSDGKMATDAFLASNGDFFLTGDSEGSSSDMLTLRYPAGFTPPPPAPLPGAPSTLSLSAAKGKITLQWSDNSNNESGFRIERAVNGGVFVQIAEVAANVRSYADSGLNKNTTYTYRVRAFNGTGDSAYSNTATGKPK